MDCKTECQDQQDNYRMFERKLGSSYEEAKCKHLKESSFFLEDNESCQWVSLWVSMNRQPMALINFVVELEKSYLRLQFLLSGPKQQKCSVEIRKQTETRPGGFHLGEDKV